MPGKIKPRGGGRGRGRQGVKQQKFTGRAIPLGKTFSGPAPNDSKLVQTTIKGASQFPNLTMERAKFETKGANGLLFILNNKTSFDVVAYSAEGVNVGRKNNAIYCQVQQPAVEQGEKYAKGSLGKYLQDMDLFAVEAYDLALPNLSAHWRVDLPPSHLANLVIENGYSEWESETNDPSKIESCMFPHSEYCKAYVQDTKTKIITPRPIEHLVKASAISKFVFRPSIKSVLFKLDPTDLKTVTIVPYANVATLTWLNDGQDSKEAFKRAQKEKEEAAEKRRIDEITEQLKTCSEAIEEDVSALQNKGGEGEGGSSSSSSSSSVSGIVLE